MPTVTFLPTFVKKSAMLRSTACAVVIVRERKLADGSIQTDDVTTLFSGDPGDFFMGGNIGLGGNKKFILQQSGTGEDQVIQSGDQFTCYVYAVRDVPGSSTEGHPLGGREEILQGRSLNGPESLTKAKIELPDGTGDSILIGKASVKITKTETYAGAVSVNFNPTDQKFQVKLENPFNLAKIKYMAWSIAAGYSYEENGQIYQETSVDGTYATTPMDISSLLEKIDFNTYQVVLEPTFDIPQNATISSYRIELEFYEADGNGDPILTAVPADGVDGTSTATNGRVSQTISGLDQGNQGGNVFGLLPLPELEAVPGQDEFGNALPEEIEEDVTEETEEDLTDETEEDDTSQQPEEGGGEQPQQPEEGGEEQTGTPAQGEQVDNTAESVQSEA